MRPASIATLPLWNGMGWIAWCLAEMCKSGWKSDRQWTAKRRNAYRARNRRMTTTFDVDRQPKSKATDAGLSKIRQHGRFERIY